jgi:hypothetical protein
LAGYIRGLAVDDPRLRLLFQVSPSSDDFTPVGAGPEFIQKLGLDVPAPDDLSASFSEFAASCAEGLTTGDPSEALVSQVRADATATQAKLNDRITELEAENEDLKLARAEDSQELSDLRGRVNALGGGQVETLSRHVASLEGELDQANRRAAAAENKTARRSRKTKVAA